MGTVFFWGVESRGKMAYLRQVAYYRGVACLRQKWHTCVYERMRTLRNCIIESDLGVCSPFFGTWDGDWRFELGLFIRSSVIWDYRGIVLNWKGRCTFKSILYINWRRALILIAV